MFFSFLCAFLSFLQRTEMVEIQLDTYTADSISAHRKIRQEAFCPSDWFLIFVMQFMHSSYRSAPLSERDSYSSWGNAHCFSLVFINLLFPCLNFREKLESELKACQVEKQSVEMKLASFEILGKEFEALAEEYCRLRQELEMKNWALKEFTQYNDKWRRWDNSQLFPFHSMSLFKEIRTTVFIRTMPWDVLPSWQRQQWRICTVSWSDFTWRVWSWVSFPVCIAI